MITVEQARRIKSQYGLLSHLEEAGIFENLTSLDRRALNFVNRLNDQKASDLILFLDGVERIMAEDEAIIYSDTSSQRDLNNLLEAGIDVKDNQRMAFVYGLINEKLNGEHPTDERREELRKTVQVKAISRAQDQLGAVEIQQPDRLVDVKLQDHVEAEVKRVELYLASYFNTIFPLLREFLPLSIEVDGGREIKIEETTIDTNYRIDIHNESQSFLRYQQAFAGVSGTRFNYCHWIFHKGEVSSQIVDSFFANELTSGKALAFYLNNDLHHLLNEALFGMSFPFPFEYQEKLREVARKSFDIERRWYFKKERKRDLDILRRVFKDPQGKISISDLLNNSLKDSEECHLRVLDDFFYKAMSYSAKGEIHFRRSTDKNDVLELIYFGPEQFEADWEQLAEQMRPLLIFNDFSAARYSLRDYKQFWQALQCYANLPSKVTEYMTTAFRDNYLALPSVDLEHSIEEVKEKLKGLEDTFRQVQSAGYLPEIATGDHLLSDESSS